MVSYVNDLRLSELATGEGSGTWGTTTNTNLELIGEALGYATEQSFGSDADATTTVGDGVSDPARAMYFKVTSAVSLTATRTLTIAPNTVSRVMFIENATSGSQSIAISQGSGANVTIATGKTAIVYLDGAGSGAAVVDAMAGVDPGVTDTLAEVLVAGNTTGGTSMVISSGDDVTFTGASANIVFDSSDSALEFADNAKAIFGSGSDLQIYHTPTGNHSIIAESGAGNLILAADNLEINNAANNANKIVATTGGAVTLFHNNAAKIATTSTGIDVTGTVTADGLTVDTDTLVVDAANNRVGIGTSSPGTPLDVAGGIRSIDSSGNPVFYLNNGTTQHALINDSNNFVFQNAGIERMRISNGGNVGIGTSSPSQELHLRQSSGDCNLLIDSANGASQIFFGDDESVNVGKIGYNHASNFMAFSANGTEAMRIDSSGNVDIGSNATASAGASKQLLSLVNPSGTTSTAARLWMSGTNATTRGAYIEAEVQSAGNDHDLIFATSASGATPAEAMRIDSSGFVGIGTSSPESGLHLFDGTNVRAPQNANRKATLTIEAGSEGSADIQMLNASYNHIFFGDAADANVGYFLYDHTNNSMQFATNAAERMRIDSSGQVGIGTSSPTALFDARAASTGLVANFRGGASNRNLQISSFDVGANINAGYQLNSTSGTGALSFAVGGTDAAYIDSTGNVGIGTTSPSKELHVMGASAPEIRLQNTSNNYALDLKVNNTVGEVKASSDLAFLPGGSEAMRLDASGNLLVGKTSSGLNTAGFEVASSGRTRLTRDSANVVEINRKTDDGSLVTFSKDGSAVGSIGTRGSDVYLETGDTGIRMYDQSDAIIPVGSAGVSRDAAIDLGISNIRFKDLYLSGSVLINAAVPRVTLTDTDGTNTIGDIRQVSDAIVIKSRNNTSNGVIKFSGDNGTTESEYARFNASGNLLVGTTSTTPAFNSTGSGIALKSGESAISADNTIGLIINRNTSDGTIQQFRKSGTEVGSIGTGSDDLYIGTGDTTIRFADGNDAIIPRGTAGAARDGAIDLGLSNNRFKDIYATNGTIQTSDRNEKQDIEVLSDAEQRVAVAAKGLLRKFRWISSVEENGDDARIHFGIIAQDLQAAFEAEGLDAGRYAMFISSTWTDDDGNEQTRLGVRYSELLAFIISAI